MNVVESYQAFEAYVGIMGLVLSVLVIPSYFLWLAVRYLKEKKEDQ